MTREEKLKQPDAQIQFYEGWLERARRKLHEYSQYESTHLSASGELRGAYHDRVISLEKTVKELKRDREHLLKEMTNDENK